MSEPSVLRVALVDDHDLFRHGIAEALATESEIELVAQARTGAELRLLLDETALADSAIDVVLLDISLDGENGLLLLPEITAHATAPKVVILSMHTEKSVVESAFAAGAAGYVLKHDAFEGLVLALRAARAGDRYVSARLLRDQPPTEFFGPEGDLPRLTPRERDVLLGFAEGLSGKEVAKRLGISVKTVQTHRARMSEKYGLKSSVDCLRHAIRAGWIEV